MKAHHRDHAFKLEDIPNVGPRIARDFRKLGLHHPKDLIKKDPEELYKKLCEITHTRHDPCVLDVFIAVIHFMNGGKSVPWWFYTRERKQLYPDT